jgi:hypothetical protein
MSDIEYGIIKKIGTLSTFASRWAKYADTSALKGEIDQLVAPRQLYGLSEDEVKIVEGK